MSIFKRKQVPAPVVESRPPTPAELLNQVRDSQEEHRETIARANARLLAEHQDIYNQAHDRQQAIEEQLKLLQTEAVALGFVKTEADVEKVKVTVS